MVSHLICTFDLVPSRSEQCKMYKTKHDLPENLREQADVYILSHLYRPLSVLSRHWVREGAPGTGYGR